MSDRFELPDEALENLLRLGSEVSGRTVREEGFAKFFPDRGEYMSDEPTQAVPVVNVYPEAFTDFEEDYGTPVGRRESLLSWFGWLILVVVCVGLGVLAGLYAAGHRISWDEFLNVVGNL